jgi:hypothetical protein
MRWRIGKKNRNIIGLGVAMRSSIPRWKMCEICLLNRYTLSRRIEGSNPSVSASTLSLSNLTGSACS